MDSAATADRDRLIDAFLALLAERGWHGFTLLDVARAAQLAPAAAFTLARSKGALLAAWVDRIDAAMLAEGAPSAAPGSEEEARSRLFDVLMRRFDALGPHRPALATLRRDLPRDPLAFFSAALRLQRSMALALELAGIGAGGIFGIMRARLLMVTEASILGTFLDDDSADLARTMAALDRQLRRLEPWAKRLENMGFRGKSADRKEPSAA